MSGLRVLAPGPLPRWPVSPLMHLMSKQRQRCGCPMRRTSWGWDTVHDTIVECHTCKATWMEDPISLVVEEHFDTASSHGYLSALAVVRYETTPRVIFTP